METFLDMPLRTNPQDSRSSFQGHRFQSHTTLLEVGSQGKTSTDPAFLTNFVRPIAHTHRVNVTLKTPELTLDLEVQDLAGQ